MSEEKNRSRLLNAQATLIGAMLIDGAIAGEVIARVPPEDFTDPTMRGLFEGCRRLYLGGKPVDAVLLASELGPGSKETIVDCMDLTPTSATWRSWAEQLRKDSALERLRELGIRLSGVLTPEEGEGLLQEGLQLFDRRTGPKRTSLAEGIDALLARLGDPAKKPRYYPLGFSALDGRVRLSPGKLAILGGYPSSGKTALALTMAFSISRSAKVGFFSLETDETDIFQRMAAYFANVRYAGVQDGTPSANELQILRDVLPVFRSENFVVERASRMNVATLQTAALSQKYDVIFLDYLQLLESDLPAKASRYEQTTRVSMELHRFAQDRGVAVVALSQLSRADRAQKNPKRPTMSDLRESGQLEQDADVVMILARDTEDPESEDRLLYIDKNKQGKLGMVRLAFDGETQRFAQKIRQEEPRRGWSLPKPRKNPQISLQEAAEELPIPEEFR